MRAHLLQHRNHDGFVLRQQRLEQMHVFQRRIAATRCIVRGGLNGLCRLDRQSLVIQHKIRCLLSLVMPQRFGAMHVPDGTAGLAATDRRRKRRRRRRRDRGPVGDRQQFS
jgi:hypothetical protein